MLSIIVAMADSQAIGINNNLPWEIKEDLQFFKNKTLNKKVVMGRKTFESIGRPLPLRENIVLTRDRSEKPHDNVSYLTLEEVLSYEPLDEEVFVIGGSEIYELFLPHVQRMYITDIFAEVQSADAFFPTYDLKDWIVSSLEVSKTQDAYHEFIQLDRKKR